MLAGEDSKPTGNVGHDDDNRGAIFVNEYKSQDNHPDFQGPCKVGGVEYRVSGWLRVSKGGKKYTSLAFTPQAEIDAAKEKRRQEEQSKIANEPDINDDIPF